MRGSAAGLAALLSLAACSKPRALPPRPAHTIHGCNPLQVGPSTSGACVTPFPSAWFEEPNAHTATGIDVRFPDGTLPANASGIVVSQKSFGQLDGYSPATPIIAWLPNGVNASQLTSPEHIEDSLSASNPIALVDLTAKARVPFFAEIDANVPGFGRHALLIHPMVRLKFSSRYAVAITTGLNDASGHPLQPQGDFALWVEGKLPNSSPLAEIADRLDEDAAVFASLGIPKRLLALAWDFDTASDAATTGPLIGMVHEALQSAPKGLPYQITQPPTTDSNGFEFVTGTFESPSFEAGPDPSILNYDANGKPVMGAPASFSFTALIPPCALKSTTPVPLAIVGHGLFETAQVDLGYDESILNQLCMVGLGAEFLGLSTPDVAPIIVGKVLVDVNNFPLVTDRLMQAHVNFQMLTRLAKNALAADPAFQVNGHPAWDTSQVYYWGASNGGIQGATFLALSPDVDRGLLHVPGAEWSFLIWRSADFASAGLVLNSSYPDPLDQQLLIGLSQSLWDRTDPIEFVSHLSTSKHVLFQQSMGDPMVSNLSTETEMRTLGVKALGPLIAPVFGLTEAPGPLDGFVYAQWSIDPMPLPGDSDTSPPDNGAHNDARLIPQCVEQMQQFLRADGQAVNPCDGPCVFPGGH